MFIDWDFQFSMKLTIHFGYPPDYGTPSHQVPKVETAHNVIDLDYLGLALVGSKHS